ncbi:MAG: RNA polymerase sigma factor [Candidatus Thioglobus sp.]|nr:RNA polymerase sigma factor [Candidatus Thioglobus sp.]
MSKEINNCFQHLQKQKTQANFQALYKLSAMRLFGVILYIVKRDDLAKDCLQEAYIKIWQRLESYDSAQSNSLTWMKSIAKNQAIDCWRKNINNNPQDSFDSQTEQIIDQNSTLLTPEMHHGDLHICLKKLKSQFNKALYLIYFYDLSYQQAAQKMDVSIGTIKSRVNRSLLNLKKCLQSL